MGLMFQLQVSDMDPWSILPSVSLPVCWLVRPSVRPSVYPSRPSIHLSVCLSICPSVHPSVRPSICPSIHPNPSIRPSVHPSVHPSIHPYVHPSVHPSVCPSFFFQGLQHKTPRFSIFLGSGPNWEQTPVKWGDFLFFHPSLHPSFHRSPSRPSRLA